jgi:hypothetical protein
MEIRENKAPNMNQKAANYGDRLKHALLLEILRRTDDWPKVIYAETHAGAGIYHEKVQVKESYIRELRQSVKSAPQPDDSLAAGAPYLAWLKDWWHDSENAGSYPGSVLTALLWLQHRHSSVPFEIRVTEKDESTCNRLRKTFRQFKAEARERSFTEELAWLTGSDDLILLVDPFGCVDSFLTSGSDRGIDNGWIDHEVLCDILERCSKKERAVVSIWWGFGQALRYYHKATCKLLKEWSRKHGNAAYRLYHDKRNHANAVLGIGKGADLAKDLPETPAWKESWLAGNVYEIN